MNSMKLFVLKHILLFGVNEELRWNCCALLTLSLLDGHLLSVDSFVYREIVSRKMSNLLGDLFLEYIDGYCFF